MTLAFEFQAESGFSLVGKVEGALRTTREFGAPPEIVLQSGVACECVLTEEELKALAAQLGALAGLFEVEV